jgi:hypothetical protein
VYRALLAVLVVAFLLLAMFAPQEDDRIGGGDTLRGKSAGIESVQLTGGSKARDPRADCRRKDTSRARARCNRDR